MKLFSCDHCGNTLYFQNDSCTACGHRIGYLPASNMMVALTEKDGVYTSRMQPEFSYVFCDNARHGACNWLIESQPGSEIFCLACRHNEMVPDLSDPNNLVHYQVIERAKKRLFYSLLRLKLPLATRSEDPAHGLGFRFLADMPMGGEQVMTGHENGIITLSLAEANDAERERRRTAMGEPYRTLLGHFRHEIGHHYWDLLVAGTPALLEFRRLFGDDTLDYGMALQRHYGAGAPLDWPQSFISNYATAHPWEDFAESWAHYLHMIDTLETAAAFGVSTAPSRDKTGALTAVIDVDPYTVDSIEAVIVQWVPVTALSNSLNRSMGLPDAYPFVLSAPVVAKLDFLRMITQQPGADSGHR